MPFKNTVEQECYKCLIVRVYEINLLYAGPSYACDSGSSGSLVAFEQAYRMLKTGTVDGVIVVGCSLLLNPVLSVMLQKMNTISPEGKSKPFDASGKY